MKIFISGQIDDAQNVRELFKKVEAKGHTITHDWTATDTFLGSKQDKLSNTEESGRRAQADIQGVIDSEVYVLSSSNENAGKGMYVELGAALALAQAHPDGNRKIYIIGPLNHMSIFYLHPLVKRFESIEDVIGEIEHLSY